MTEQAFKAIKLMQKGGATVKDILEYYAVSVDTLRRIRRVDTFAEYIANQRAHNAPKKQEKKEERQEKPQGEPLKLPGGQLSSGYQMNRIYEALKEQNEILKLLSNKVAFIVDELTR